MTPTGRRDPMKHVTEIRNLTSWTQRSEQFSSTDLRGRELFPNLAGEFPRKRVIGFQEVRDHRENRAQLEFARSAA